MVSGPAFSVPPYLAQAFKTAAAAGAAGKLDATAASTLFAPSGGGVIGHRMVALGDSGTEGFATGTRSDNWVTICALSSQGRIHLVKNAGKGGDTTAMMLARIDADVLPYKPHFCTVQGGGNDWSTNVDFEVTKANLKAIVAKLRATNVVPVLTTINPRPSTNDTTVAIRNAWIRRYAESERLILIDFNALVADTVTGGWKAGESTDNIHALSVPLYQMGRYAYEVLKPYLAGPILTGRAAVFNNDTTNMVKNAIFATTYSSSAGPIPDQWAANAVTGRVHTVSAADPAIGGGKWMSMERTAGTDRAFVSQYNDANPDGWAIGDRIAYGFWLRVPTLDTAAYYSIGTSGLAESRAPIEAMTQTLPDPVFVYREFDLTAVPIQETFIVNLYGVGKVEISKPKMINLTKRGAVIL